MKYLCTMSYYCTVNEKVTVEAENKKEAIQKVENGEFQQLKEKASVDIDWDSITVEEIINEIP